MGPLSTPKQTRQRGVLPAQPLTIRGGGIIGGGMGAIIFLQFCSSECNVLQLIAMDCNGLQLIASECNWLQLIAIDCNFLQFIENSHWRNLKNIWPFYFSTPAPMPPHIQKVASSFAMKPKSLGPWVVSIHVFLGQWIAIALMNLLSFKRWKSSVPANLQGARPRAVIWPKNPP